MKEENSSNVATAVNVAAAVSDDDQIKIRGMLVTAGELSPWNTGRLETENKPKPDSSKN